MQWKKIYWVQFTLYGNENIIRICFWPIALLLHYYKLQHRVRFADFTAPTVADVNLRALITGFGNQINTLSIDIERITTRMAQDAPNICANTLTLLTSEHLLRLRN